MVIFVDDIAGIVKFCVLCLGFVDEGLWFVDEKGFFVCYYKDFIVFFNMVCLYFCDEVISDWNVFLLLNSVDYVKLW